MSTGICRVIEQPIDVNEIIASVSDPSVGAIVPFIGVVRKFTGDRQTRYLQYEAYHEMAISEMKRIMDEANKKFGPVRVSIAHRVGRLEIGDIAVVTAVGAPHRAVAFEASKYVIDRIKEIVPIWKKEMWDDGEEWVGPQTGPF